MFLGVHNLNTVVLQKSLCSSKISCFLKINVVFLSHQQHKLLQSLKGVASVL